QRFRWLGARGSPGGVETVTSTTRMIRGMLADPSGRGPSRGEARVGIGLSALIALFVDHNGARGGQLLSLRHVWQSRCASRKSADATMILRDCHEWIRSLALEDGCGDGRHEDSVVIYRNGDCDGHGVCCL